MTPRRIVLVVLAVAALALVVARTFQGRADWSPPRGPAEPGPLSP